MKFKILVFELFCFKVLVFKDRIYKNGILNWECRSYFIDKCYDVVYFMVMFVLFKFNNRRFKLIK